MCIRDRVTAMQDAAAEMGTKEGFHGYGPEQGYPFLKQAIQSYYACLLYTSRCV